MNDFCIPLGVYFLTSQCERDAVMGLRSWPGHLESHIASACTKMALQAGKKMFATRGLAASIQRVQDKMKLVESA